MNLNVPNKIFECVAGSVAYGLNTPDSDIDIRGIFRRPNEELLGLVKYDDLIKDDKNDIQFYELKRFFELAIGSNPNILELLFMPDDCIKVCTAEMEKIIVNRDLFISKKTFDSFWGYSTQQIKRCKGVNKWINNPQPEDPPSKLDFCWVIPLFSSSMSDAWECNYSDDPKEFPMRPIKLCECPKGYDIDLSKMACAKLEHSHNIYRLYDVPNAKGVFRGKNQQLVTESIEKGQEIKNICALLIFNEEEYEKSRKDWKNYWDWKKNRNEARYRDQESGKTEYDCKNVMHCLRLIWSCTSILEGNGPIIRFSGSKKDVLMGIRHGIYKYDDVMKIVEEHQEKMSKLEQESRLPDEIDVDKVNELYLSIIGGRINT